MLNRIVLGFCAALVSTAVSSPSNAQRNPAAKANLYQSSLVQGVAACTTANTTQPGTEGVVGCDPVIPNDDLCKFGPKGFGKLKFKAKDDLKFQVKLRGLDPTCDGEVLCTTADLLITQDVCDSGGSCTTEPIDDLPFGATCCDVAFGKCDIRTTLTEALHPDTFVLGNRTEYTLGGVSLVRFGGDVDKPAFRAGMLVP